MRVLITLMPTHLSKFSLIPVALIGIGSGLGTMATSILDGQVPSFQNFLNNMFVFADLQANVVGTGIERHIAKHAIPGREGFVLQDMGGKSTEITVTGKWIYENSARDGLTDLFSKISGILGSNIGWNWLRIELFKTLARINLPLMFACDLFIGPVLIEKVEFKYVGGQPNVYDYKLKLIEWNPALSIAGTLAITAIQGLGKLIGMNEQGIIRGR